MDINKIGAQVSKLGGKVKDTASLAKENWKIDAQIKDVQNELNDAYRMLGFLYYEKAKKEDGAEEDTFTEQAESLMQDIDEKAKQLSALSDEKNQLTQKHGA